ncbi:alpha-1,3-mannosyl-glycoprotein 2-beta-N-acetylglucosaminyltransferase-like [Oppia nitens]|uniref:alpha-1,3-mannosyl-glycoprotein 2-beta-N-acetylglucosaminyltransferase-like n=1 Tax=Oppia nitens TaxID=1686743 RepID=UPI0023DA03EE|nr:alpha-1,3-mannosyl-glycoprotein 2-beta-N-acetylglucosaminyltransferase-like [Oppia nitens]XP_054162626.1 alpha-1,3-mannosyl-glycoprotein 2-beta-N-acetylglucosaminyltransferase-like [Oppia nitens]
MRRKTFYLIGCLSFICWTAVLCYLFVHKPNTIKYVYKYEEVNKEVDILENELKQQLKSNEALLMTLKNIKEQIIKTGKDIKHILAENPSALSMDRTVDINKDPVICVLLFACNRITIKRNLDQLLKYRPNPRNFPIVVSQDCGHEPTRKVIQSYGEQLTLIRQPDQSDIPLTGKAKKFKGYYKIARHYGWALNQTFHTLNYDTVIIIEDDLDLSPDFFEYFRALYPLLKTDPTLYCISAWNDNGKDGLVSNEADKLFRSDFFPGLGWMLTKDIWLEFENKWPKAFWDDWIREPAQRKDRACIRPEMSRTRTFGKIGVSNGLFYEKHLKFIKLNEESVPFTQINLTYLLKENYDVDWVKTVYGSPTVTLQQLLRSDIPSDGPIRITYGSKDGYKKAAKALGLMDDFKSGVPRTGYRGVVTFMRKGRRVYLAPPPTWKQYDITWR